MTSWVPAKAEPAKSASKDKEKTRTIGSRLRVEKTLSDTALLDLRANHFPSSDTHLQALHPGTVLGTTFPQMPKHGTVLGIFISPQKGNTAAFWEFFISPQKLNTAAFWPF